MFQLDVRDFGATGDGVTDDTAALLAASAAQKRTIVRKTFGTGQATFRSVFFPAGTYRITGPVDWGAYADLVGDAGVQIDNQGTTAGFVFSGGYIVRVSQMLFTGGPAILFSNANANGARLHVWRGRFDSINGIAVQAIPQSGGWFSSAVSLDECNAFGCKQLLVSWADMNRIGGGWLQWAETDAVANSAYIEIRGGHLSTIDTMLVPVFPTNNKQCVWILFAGAVTGRQPTLNCAQGTKFHGEYGGLPIVRVTAVPDAVYPFMGPQIGFDGCQLSGGQASRPDSAVIQLQSGLPQTTSVKGCSGVIGPMPLILDQVGNVPAMLAAMANVADRVRIEIGCNSFYPEIPPVPAGLVTYIRTP